MASFKFKKQLKRYFANSLTINLKIFITGLFIKRHHFQFDQSMNLIVNGPSLINAIKQISSSTSKSMVVNHFADSPLFEELKPQYYLFQDTYFWQKGNQPHYDVKRTKTFEFISQKTDWPLLIILPHYADLEFVRKNIRNVNVQFATYFASYFFEPLQGRLSLIKPYRWLLYCWKHNYLAPPPENVLVGATYVCFLGGVERLCIYGADLSFFKEIEIDQKTNVLGIWNSHFYGKEFRRQYKYKTVGSPLTTIGSELGKWSRVFHLLSTLDYFYKKNGLHVLNCSTSSYLDAFDRCSAFDESKFASPQPKIGKINS